MGQPDGSAFVEDDLICLQFEREGDRLGLTRPQSRRHQPRWQESMQGHLTEPRRLDDARRFGNDRRRHGDGTEHAAQAVKPSKVAERDQWAGIADGGGSAAISRIACFSASHSSSV